MIINPTIFREWIDSYGPRVGLNNFEGGQMLASWFDELEKKGVTSEELALASDAAAKKVSETPPKVKSEHRSIFMAALDRVRSLRVYNQNQYRAQNHEARAMDGPSIRSMLVERGLLTDRHRREVGLPTIKEQRLAEREEVPEEDRGDAWEPPGVTAKQ